MLIYVGFYSLISLHMLLTWFHMKYMLDISGLSWSGMSSVACMHVLIVSFKLGSPLQFGLHVSGVGRRYTLRPMLDADVLYVLRFYSVAFV